MKNKKYFVYSRYEVGSEGILKNIYEIMNNNEEFSIVIINTEFKVDLSKLNLKNFNRVYMGNFRDFLTNNRPARKEIINLFVPNEFVLEDTKDFLIGKEISHVFIITEKPCEKMKQVFKYAKSRIRGLWSE